MGTTYVATDGHRLGIAQRGSATPVTFSALVPLDAAKALAVGRTRDETRSLPPWISRGLVAVAVHSDGVCEYLFLRNAGRVFCVKLPKMALPPYANVIPERFTVSALVNGRALLDTIRDVTAATAPESVGVLLTVMPGRIRVAYDCETVKSSGEAPVDYCGTTSPTIGLDPELVSDALSTLDGDVFIGINGKEDPIVVSSAEFTGTDTNKYIIMPMRK
jgi:DNA polymerase III sliding clamp (beta) subunit (PCNA family)